MHSMILENCTFIYNGDFCGIMEITNQCSKKAIGNIGRIKCNIIDLKCLKELDQDNITNETVTIKNTVYDSDNNLQKELTISLKDVDTFIHAIYKSDYKSKLNEIVDNLSSKEIVTVLKYINGWNEKTNNNYDNPDPFSMC